MNWIKALFISLFLLLNLAALVQSAVALFSAGLFSPWLGAFIASVSVWGVFGVIGAGKTARTSRNLPAMLIGAGIGGVYAVLAGLWQEWAWLPFLYAVVASFAGSYLYIHWYSVLDRSQSPNLQVGRGLPEFRLQTPAGELIESSAFTSAPALWLFYRGNWCPLCMAQIDEVAAQYRQLQAHGVSVNMVSPQPHEQTEKLAKRVGVEMNFLVDANNAAARSLGIAHERGLPLGMEATGYDADTVMPTVLITDASGKIVYSHQTDNYRVRPEPDVFLQIIAQLGLAEQPVSA